MENIPKIGSNKSFGIVFFIFFFILGLYPVINDGEIKIWLIAISIVFLILGLLNSKILSPLNIVWFRFGIFLGKIISPIVMIVIFFIVVTPIGLLMRLLGKDILNLKYNNNKSYWIKKNDHQSKMKNQF